MITKKYFAVVLFISLGCSFANATQRDFSFYTNRCANDVAMLQTAATASEGHLIFNVSCSQGGVGSNGEMYKNQIVGSFKADIWSGNYKFYTDRCAEDVATLQIITNSTDGHLVVQAFCSQGGYGSNGLYYKNSVIVSFQNR